MRQPCESVVQSLLPAFRSLVAKELVGKCHLSQVAAATKLGTKQATIGQYFTSKRGSRGLKAIRGIQEVRAMAKENTNRIATGKTSSDDVLFAFCEALHGLEVEGADLPCTPWGFPILRET